MTIAPDRPFALSKSDWRSAPLTCCAIQTGRLLSGVGVGLSDAGHKMTLWGIFRLIKLGVL